uniref:Rab-like protein 2A n=1 Tax=Laticauda laticaudata TaxID=8630 RepID=A0A8C5SDQ5_LATLA
MRGLARLQGNRPVWPSAAPSGAGTPLHAPPPPPARFAKGSRKSATPFLGRPRAHVFARPPPPRPAAGPRAASGRSPGNRAGVSRAGPMAEPRGPEGEPPHAALDQAKYDAEENVKIICLGDSAVGKSKLMERFLMEGFKPQQLSTFALTLYKYTATVDGKTILVDFWDTAGQERFQSMHASYYHKAHACIMVFDVQRKVTYKNLTNWYKELREFRPQIPCIVVANKIDADLKATQKSFNFPKKLKLPLYFVSAADGTNVVKLFSDAIQMAVAYKQNSGDFMDEVLKELDNFDLEMKEEDSPTEETSQGESSPVHLSPRNE